MNAVYQKELRSYFANPVGSLFIALMLSAVGLFFTMTNLRAGYPLFEYALSANSGAMVFVLLMPLLAMRSFAEERHAKTDQLLYSLPVSGADVVMGKFFALATVLAVPTAVLCLFPPILSLYADAGSFGYAGAYTALFFFYLLGLVLGAVCMFLSSLAESQLVAAVTGAFTLLGIYFLPRIAAMLPATGIASVVGFLLLILVAALILYRVTGSVNLCLFSALGLCVVLLAAYLIAPDWFLGSFSSLLRALGLFELLNGVIYGGLFDLKVCVAYLSVTAFFLLLTVMVLEKRRWN